MAKSMLLNVLENTLTYDNQQESENNATLLTVDFTGVGVDTWAKWLDIRLADGTGAPISLGLAIVPTYSIPAEFMKEGRMEIQAYAQDGTNTYKSKVFSVTVKRSLDIVDNTATYDPTTLGTLQQAISDMEIQIDEVYDAYMAGEFDATLAVGTVSTGAPGTSVIITNTGTNHDAVFNFTIPKGDTGAQGVQGETGASPITAGFVGNDMVFTKDDASTITLVGAKLLLKGDTGNTGATGATGATIVSGSFVGNDMVFVNSDSSTVTLVGAKTALKGDQGIQGVIGLTGAQGIQGEAATITIGSVTTGNAGTSASVVNAGTVNDAVLNFTIPRGDVGESGVYVGTTEPTDPDHIVWIDTDGTPDIVAEDVVELTSGNETTLHKHNATNTPFTPTGNLSSTNVQTALAELDNEKASKTELYSLLNQDRRIFGVSWNGTSSPVLTRTGYAVGLTAQVGIDNQVVVNDFDNLPIWRWEDVTDNYGNVFKRIPKVYIRKTAVGDARTWEVSQYKGDGFYLPWCFWDFVNNKELNYVDVGKYQASKSVDNKLESKPLTYPLVNTSIVNFRTYARANGAGYGQFDIHVADLLQTLFIIEFATLNSQSVMPGFTNGQYSATRLAVLTETAVNRVVLTNANADVFRVGQPISIGTSQGGNQVFYGRTITAINVVDASNKELVFDGTPVNITAGNMVYNTGWRSGWSSAVLAKSGTIIANDGFYPMMYRGIESLYGDVWEWVDGVNINARQAWVCENQDQYVSNLFTAPFKQLSYINKDVSNYVSKMGMDFANPYANFPVETSGDSTTFYSDYYYQNTGQYVARLGGSWVNGAAAGLFYWALHSSSSSTYIDVGGRLIRKAV